MGAWMLDNWFSIISFVLLIIGYIVSAAKLSEKLKSEIKTQGEDIEELRQELAKEKEQNKQNYLKQESKLEDCISLISTKFDDAILALNARIDKIDEIKTDIALMKNDIAYMKEEITSLKDDVKYLKDK